MSYQRRILHYSSNLTTLIGEISVDALAGCWFELHRKGGCGAGELTLRSEFPVQNSIDIGDWIAFEYSSNDRWYLGRIEEREAELPAGVVYQLQGMSVQLGEVFPGGFDRSLADEIPPHRYAMTDLFPHDPDYSDETVDTVSLAPDVAWSMLQQYAAGKTNIGLDINNIDADPNATIVSMKFRGEESLRSIMKDLALRSGNASWGVDADGNFFFLQEPLAAQKTFQVGTDILSLQESQNLDLIYNRVLLTGDYVYNELVNTDVPERGFYRWRGIYVQPQSREQYGERRIRLWIPWIRSNSDATQFVTEFFKIYSTPTTRYRIEVEATNGLVIPWGGPVTLKNKEGIDLITASVETVRVQFDETPIMELEIGHEAPQESWPEPEQDERFEIGARRGGGRISLSDFSGLTTSSLTSSSLSSSSGESSSYLSSGLTIGESSSSEESSDSSMISSGSSDLDSSGETAGPSGGSASDNSSMNSSSNISSSEVSSEESNETDSSEESDSQSGNDESQSGGGGESGGGGGGSSAGGSGSNSGGSSAGANSSSGGEDGGTSGENSSGVSNSSDDSSSDVSSSLVSSSSSGSSSSSLCDASIYDNFSDTNGTSLSAHTPDVAPSGTSWTDPDGSFKLYNGHASYLELDCCTEDIAYVNSSLSDVIVSAEIEIGSKRIQGDDDFPGMVGVMARYTPGGSGYVAAIDNGEVRLMVGGPNSYVTLIQKSHSRDAGETVEITIECQGNNLTATIDGNTITYNSATLRGTHHGIYAETYEDDIDSSHKFNDFMVDCYS